MSAPRKRGPGRVDLVFDLETVTDPGLKDQEKDKAGKSRFPSPPCHQIVCAGYALLEDYVVQSWGVLDEDEETIVRKLVDTIETLSPRVIGFNSKGFDMPTLAGRAFRHGVSFGWLYRTKLARYRYDATVHLDLMDYLADYSGFGRNASLDVWARLCGWPGKGDVSGSDVSLMYASGQIAEIGKYCLGDVCQTVAVLLRADLLRGEMTMAQYLHASLALVDHAEADERTAALAFAVDRARFLLDPSMNDREAAE